ADRGGTARRGAPLLVRLLVAIDRGVTELHHVAEELVEPKVIRRRCQPDRLADLLLRLDEPAAIPRSARRALEGLDDFDDRDALGEAPAGRERDGLAVVVCDELGDLGLTRGGAVLEVPREPNVGAHALGPWEGGVRDLADDDVP